MAKNSIPFNLSACICFTVLLAIVQCDNDVCHQETPCLCRFNDQHSLNVTHLLPDNNYISTNHSNYTFYFHGCMGAHFDVDLKLGNGSSCTSDDATLCVYDATIQRLDLLGLASSAKFRQDKDHPHINELVYQNDTVTSIVTLICAIDYPEVTMVLHSMDKNVIRLHVFSAHACKIFDYNGLSLGTKLIIMLLVFSSLYLIGGNLISYYIRGARGKEVIPNIDFWMELPGLVKDGVLFIMNGCNARMVPTADTYDQI